MGLEGVGRAFLPQLQMLDSWNYSPCLEGGGERGPKMAGTPPRVGQLLLCQQQAVIWCVVASGAPGPSARCLEIAHLGQEDLEDPRVGLLL